VSTPSYTKKSFEDVDPGDYELAEGEERRFIDPRSQKVDHSSLSSVTRRGGAKFHSFKKKMTLHLAKNFLSFLCT
jgi:hypothetical protein